MLIAGGPDLGGGSLADKRDRLACDHAALCRGIVDEPRGSEALVGAMIVPASDPTCVAAVIFFNTVGVLGMCGHGTMGLARTLAHLDRIGVGSHRIETPVGVVEVTLRQDGMIEVMNVAARRARTRVTVEFGGIGIDGGVAVGDVAWGGNWFFITEAPVGVALDRHNSERLTRDAWEIRGALARAGVVGDDGCEIDHIEFTAPAIREDCSWRNFVLCPGGAYDRSPCGTGTSAKLACLAADGKLLAGDRVGAESFVGTRFEAWYDRREGAIIPTIAGRAWITAELDLILDDADPCCFGIRR